MLARFVYACMSDMSAPEPVRTWYWAVQVTGLVLLAVVLIVAGIAWGGDPIGYVIAALCLFTAVWIVVMWRRRRL